MNDTTCIYYQIISPVINLLLITSTSWTILTNRTPIILQSWLKLEAISYNVEIYKRWRISLLYPYDFDAHDRILIYVVPLINRRQCEHNLNGWSEYFVKKVKYNNPFTGELIEAMQWNWCIECHAIWYYRESTWNEWWNYWLSPLQLLCWNKCYELIKTMLQAILPGMFREWVM